MKKSQLLSIAAVCAMAIASAACSSSSTPAPAPTAPTVSSIAISGGNAQALPTASTISTTTGTTTNVSTATSSIAVTFSTAMTVSTVTTSNVTLTCASGTAPTLGTPTTADDTTFTFAVTGTFPQKATCTLGFTASITNSSGTAITATSTAFATGCSSSDDLSNSSTIAADGAGCYDTRGSGFAATISSATSGLVETVSTDTGSASVGGTKSFADGSVTTSVTITSPTQLNMSGCGIVYTNAAGTSGFHLMVTTDGMGTYQVDAFSLDFMTLYATTLTLAAAPSTSAPLTLTITPGATNYSISCAQTGTDCSTLALTTPQTVISDATTIGAVIIGDATNTCTFGDGTASNGFVVNGTATNGPTGTTGGQD